MEGREVVVKKLGRSSNQWKEFMNEAKLFARVQHRNVVNLLGYCAYVNEKLLVYECLPHQRHMLFLGKLRQLDLTGNIGCYQPPACSSELFEFQFRGRPIVILPSSPDQAAPYDDDP